MSDNPNITRPVGWEADQINSAIEETKIKFHRSNADILEAFKNGGEREVSFDENGTPHALYDREVMPLTDALTRWAADAEDGVCDRRTLPRSLGGGRRGISSKADLVTVADRVKYIEQFGLEQYERLDSKPQQTSELRFQDDFRRLPLAEKARLVRLHGVKFVESLPVRPTGQPHGGFIAHEKLEKIKRIQGKSPR